MISAKYSREHHKLDGGNSEKIGEATRQRRQESPSLETMQPVWQLQQQVGNQAVQQLLRSGFIQAKLAISNPDAPEEREADNVAHAIMRSHAGAPVSTPCSCSHDGEMCEECQQKQSQPTIHRRASSPSAPGQVPRIVSDVLRSPGHPLDSATRAFFEPRFGHDFSQVRIHTDTRAAESARAIQARAYTAGNDIVFDSGEWTPDRAEGRHLLAHELTHVVQQRGGSSAPGIVQRKPSPECFTNPGAPAPGDTDPFPPGQEPVPEGNVYRPDASVDECFLVVCVCSVWDPTNKTCWGRPVPCGAPSGPPEFKEPQPESEQPPESDQPPRKLKSYMSKMLCGMGFTDYCPGLEDIPSVSPLPERERRAIESQSECEEKKKNCERMTSPASEVCLNTLPPECAAWTPIWEEPSEVPEVE